MNVHPAGPGVEQQAPEAREVRRTVGGYGVSDRVLHPCICGDDEVARQPRAEEDHEGREPVPARAEALLAEEKQAEEGGFEEEGEDPFHRQRLADDAAGIARELRPVGAELKLHRDAGDDAEQKVDGEDLRPETRRRVVTLVAFPQGQRLEDDDERRKPHRQLREQVMKRDRESEVQAVNRKRRVHRFTSRSQSECNPARPSGISSRSLTSRAAQHNRWRGMEFRLQAESFGFAAFRLKAELHASLLIVHYPLFNLWRVCRNVSRLCGKSYVRVRALPAYISA